MTWNIKIGDCVALMADMPDNSVDAIVTDPPYGIGFQGRKWDRLPPGRDWADQCLRVLKPGGHVVAFGGSRTVHRLTCALEDSGFEIRDVINWLTWTGFPKSMSVDVAGFEGFQTALKPAAEPAILARKPLEGTVAQNVAKWGTGALHVDACRVRDGDPAWPGPSRSPKVEHAIEILSMVSSDVMTGRWPANVYACPKPSRAERDRGCENLSGVSGAEATRRAAGSAGIKSPRAGAGRKRATLKNHHPTVKPVRLMSWLCRLVGGQPGSLILDPFCGSGTTGIAAVGAGFDFIGFEISTEYAEIAAARIVGHAPLFNGDAFDAQFAGVKR